MDVVQVLENLKQGVVNMASDTVWYSNSETFADRVDAIKDQYISETNGQIKIQNRIEKIQSMSVEELAELLMDNHECPECCIGSMDDCIRCEYKDLQAMKKYLLDIEK